MTDHKFTDDDVIKALECCRTIRGNDCKNCAYHRKIYELGLGRCVNDLVCDALALINRQKAEIESLQAVHADMTESLRLAAEANKDMQAEIERLKREAKIDESEIKCTRIHRDMARAEAIKEFAQRLKSDLGRIPQHQFTRSQVEWSINTFVKEMTEEQK